MSYDDLLQEFLEKGISVAERLHTDTRKVSSLLEQVKKTTDFNAILEQRQAEKEKFLQECKDFATTVHSWLTEYPSLITACKAVLGAIISDLTNIPGLLVYVTDTCIRITYNEKEAVYSAEGRPALTQHSLPEEQRFVHELAELIALELRLHSFLEGIANTAQKRNILDVCRTVQAGGDINDAGFIKSMNILITWWNGSLESMNELKTALAKGLTIDDKIARTLKELIAREEQEKRQDKKRLVKLSVAKCGAEIVVDMLLNFIPFGVGSFISAARKAHDLRKEIKNIKNS